MPPTKVHTLENLLVFVNGKLSLLTAAASCLCSICVCVCAAMVKSNRKKAPEETLKGVVPEPQN